MDKQVDQIHVPARVNTSGAHAVGTTGQAGIRLSISGGAEECRRAVDKARFNSALHGAWNQR